MSVTGGREEWVKEVVRDGFATYRTKRSELCLTSWRAPDVVPPSSPPRIYGWVYPSRDFAPPGGRTCNVGKSRRQLKTKVNGVPKAPSLSDKVNPRYSCYVATFSYPCSGRRASRGRDGCGPDKASLSVRALSRPRGGQESAGDSGRGHPTLWVRLGLKKRKTKANVTH